VIVTGRGLGGAGGAGTSFQPRDDLIKANIASNRFTTNDCVQCEKKILSSEFERCLTTTKLKRMS
jgi:hypothetical protein